METLDLLLSVDIVPINKPENFLIALIYTSWQTLDLFKRSKLKTSHFAAISGLPFTSSTKKVCKQIVEAIRKLSGYLTWNENSDDTLKSNPLHHLKDILECPNIVKEKFLKDRKTIPENMIQESSNLVHYFNQRISNELIIQEDEEISDEEIDSYIRTEKEINFLTNLSKE